MSMVMRKGRTCSSPQEDERRDCLALLAAADWTSCWEESSDIEVGRLESMRWERLPSIPRSEEERRRPPLLEELLRLLR